MLSKIEYKKVTLIAREEDLSAESTIKIMMVVTSNNACEVEADSINYFADFEIK